MDIISFDMIRRRPALQPLALDNSLILGYSQLFFPLTFNGDASAIPDTIAALITNQSNPQLRAQEYRLALHKAPPSSEELLKRGLFRIGRLRQVASVPLMANAQPYARIVYARLVRQRLQHDRAQQITTLLFIAPAICDAGRVDRHDEDWLLPNYSYSTFYEVRDMMLIEFDGWCLSKHGRTTLKERYAHVLRIMENLMGRSTPRGFGAPPTEPRLRNPWYADIQLGFMPWVIDTDERAEVERDVSVKVERE
jgi:hypothetical protein